MEHTEAQRSSIHELVKGVDDTQTRSDIQIVLVLRFAVDLLGVSFAKYYEKKAQVFTYIICPKDNEHGLRCGAASVLGNILKSSITDSQLGRSIGISPV